jgi:glutathione peroxidase
MEPWRGTSTMRWLATLVLGLIVAAAGQARAEKDGAFRFALTAIDGTPLPLAPFAGKAVLVVNTASFCGFTGQYAGLQRLWEEYRERGLVVIGVPSGDFGGQEYAKNSQIKEFCETRFDLDFPLAEKVKVRGPHAHPLFAWLRDELGEEAGPRWNFFKYLVGPDGRAVAFWPSSVEPDAPEIRRRIESVLPVT